MARYGHEARGICEAAMTSLKLEIVKGQRPVASHTLDAACAFVSRRRADAARAAAAELEAARDEAARIVALARSEAEQIRRGAYEEGSIAGERAWSSAARELSTLRLEAVARLERDCVLLS